MEGPFRDMTLQEVVEHLPKIFGKHTEHIHPAYFEWKALTDKIESLQKENEQLRSVAGAQAFKIAELEKELEDAFKIGFDACYNELRQDAKVVEIKECVTCNFADGFNYCDLYKKNIDAEYEVVGKPDFCTAKKVIIILEE